MAKKYTNGVDFNLTVAFAISYMIVFLYELHVAGTVGKQQQ